MNTDHIQQDNGGARGARQRNTGDAAGLPPLQVLTVEQAAEFLHLHPVTIQCKARRGEIPAAKLGKRWIFLEIDLMAWIRAQYHSRVMQGEHEEVKICRSTNVKILPSIGLACPTTETSYRKALGLPTR